MFLSMSPRELRACADIFTREANSQNAIYNIAEKHIQQVGHQWLGTAYDGYLQQFTKQRVELQKRTDALRSFAELLRTTADRFEEMDNFATRFFRTIVNR